MKKIAICSFFAILLAGCAGTSAPVKESTASTKAPSEPVDRSHDIALQHFIDGSICELKGEYAQAVLEYQDALRYEKNHATFFALAKNYAMIGKHALAIEAGREAVRLAPDNTDYRKVLAESFIAGFEIDSAIAQYEEVIKRDSSNIDAWFSVAHLQQTRRPLRALEAYDQITERFGPQWDVLLQVAELCNKLGKVDRAAAALKQMTEIDPSNQELKRTLGQTYVRAGKADSALAVFEELCELNPENLDYRAERGGVLLMKKDYAGASEQFAPILARDTVAIETKLRIGELYFSQLEKDSTLAPLATRIFQKIRAANPGDWRPYWFLGAIGSIRHIDSLAVPNFKRVTELASWNADAWVYLSSTFLEKNDFTQVASILESALKALPDDFRVNFFLGIAYSRTGRNPDAVRVLEHARQINPKDVDAITQLALVYDSMKKPDESDSLYEEALRLAPDNHLALNNYAYSLAERNLQLDRALTMAKKAIKAQPEQASYLDTIGWVYFRLGQFDDAEKFVKKAVEKGEASAVVYEHLGDIYFRLNQRDKAVEQWNAALKMDEKNSALRDKISRGSF